MRSGGNGNIGGSVTIGADGHHALAVAVGPEAQIKRMIGGTLELSAVAGVLDRTAGTAPTSGSYASATATGSIVGSLSDTVVDLAGVSGSVAVVDNSLVLTGSSGGSAYDSWAAFKGLNGSNNGLTPDRDFDGKRNSWEFMLGGNPLASDPSKLPTLSTTATDFVFTFSSADDSEVQIGLTFQHGSTLAGWTNVPIGAGNSTTPPASVVVTENAASANTVVVTVPKASGAGGRLFGRPTALK